MDYNKLWSLINKKNLSKSAAGRVAGMSPQGFISMMDNETMSVATLEAYCKFFGVPVSYFFESTEAEPKRYPENDSILLAQEECLKCAGKQQEIDALKREKDLLNMAINALNELLDKYREDAKKKSDPNDATLPG